MEKTYADITALQITNNILRTDPRGIIKDTSSSHIGAAQVADFIKHLSIRLQKDIDFVAVNADDFR